MPRFTGKLAKIRGNSDPGGAKSEPVRICSPDRKNILYKCYFYNDNVIFCCNISLAVV